MRLGFNGFGGIGRAVPRRALRGDPDIADWYDNDANRLVEMA
ncbi:hypothetical protein ACIBO2_32655 [Nonomuraea sp. NPDC050022]